MSMTVTAVRPYRRRGQEISRTKIVASCCPVADSNFSKFESLLLSNHREILINSAYKMENHILEGEYKYRIAENRQTNFAIAFYNTSSFQFSMTTKINRRFFNRMKGRHHLSKMVTNKQPQQCVIIHGFISRVPVIFNIYFVYYRARPLSSHPLREWLGIPLGVPRCPPKILSSK